MLDRLFYSCYIDLHERKTTQNTSKEVKQMPRLTVATVKTQLEAKGLVLRLIAGKGYSVYKKGAKQNILEIQFKNLDELVAKHLTGKIDAKKMLKVEGMKEAVTHANSLTKMDTASIKKRILKCLKEFDKKDVQDLMRQVEQREMTLAEINNMIDKMLPIRTERNRVVFLKDNKLAKQLFSELRENFKVEIAGNFFLSQVK